MSVTDRHLTGEGLPQDDEGRHRAHDALPQIDDALRQVERTMQLALQGPRPAVQALYHWLSYHLGWTDIDGRPARALRGKLLRPRACLLASAAAGSLTHAAVTAAAAVELTHAFSLIHDDLEDGDELRRGRPTLWKQVGEAQAINAGDALLILARLTLGSATLSDHRLGLAYRYYDTACLQLTEGQYLDLSFERSQAVSLEGYTRMIEAKTGALLGASLALGALCGGAARPVADALGEFGRRVGVAFQMWDDVLGLWGDPAVTGKPAGADLLRRKRSLPMVLGLADPELADPLMAWLSHAQGEHSGPLPANPADHKLTDQPSTDRGPMDYPPMDLIRRLDERGHRRAATAMAQQAADEAVAILASLALQPGPSAQLRELAQRAVRRDA